MRDTIKGPGKRIMAAAIIFCLTAIGVATALLGSTAAPGLNWNAPSLTPQGHPDRAKQFSRIRVTDSWRCPIPCPRSARRVFWAYEWRAQ